MASVDSSSGDNKIINHGNNPQHSWYKGNRNHIVYQTNDKGVKNTQKILMED
jgi:hypothetical protein